MGWVTFLISTFRARQGKSSSQHVWPSGLRRQTQDLLGVTPHEFKSRSVQSFYTLSASRSNFISSNFSNGNDEALPANKVFRTLRQRPTTTRDSSKSTKTTATAK